MICTYNRIWSKFNCMSSIHSPTGFLGGPDGKESACNSADLGSISVSGRSPEGENDNPLQYSHLENSMERAVWGTIVHGVPKSWTWLGNKQPYQAGFYNACLCWFSHHKKKKKPMNFLVITLVLCSIAESDMIGQLTHVRVHTHTQCST